MYKKLHFFPVEQAACWGEGDAACASRAWIWWGHTVWVCGAVAEPCMCDSSAITCDEVLNVGIWAWHALLAKINCPDRCCVQTNISQVPRPYVPAALMLPCLSAGRVFSIWYGPRQVEKSRGNVLTLSIATVPVSVVSASSRIKAESRFLEHCLVYLSYFQDTCLDSSSWNLGYLDFDW